MGLKPFLAQRRTLGNPESVLLIHHDQAQLRKLHAFLNEGMGANNNVYLSCRDSLLDFLLSGLIYIALK